MSQWTQLIDAVREQDVPAPLLRPVLLAQCIVESARGTSRLALDHGNFAGIKWRPEMKGHGTKVQYGAHDGVDDYCAFDSPAAFVRAYGAFIDRSVYDGWRAFENDPEGYIAFLKSRNYAADPDYVAKILGVLPEARALLAADPSAMTEPDRPSRNLLGETVGDRLDLSHEPDFVSVAGVVHKFQGVRPAGLEGAIVHYDAGRPRPRRGDDDPESGARSTLNTAVANGYAYCAISRSGKVYLPANMSWDKWGYHAGESRIPGTNRTRVSQFFVGFEVNSPGFVFPTGDADVFVPWFNSVRDAKGNVILSKGRATLLNADDLTYRKAELRHFAKPNGNIRAGAYVPFTVEQMKALSTVILWLKRQYPKTFRLEHVFGHDEVSPLRKIDPGGSLGAAGDLAMTMAQFRADLLRRWADLSA